LTFEFGRKDNKHDSASGFGTIESDFRSSAIYANMTGSTIMKMGRPSDTVLNRKVIFMLKHLALFSGLISGQLLNGR